MKKGLAALVFCVLVFACAGALAGGDDYPAKYKNAARDAMLDEWNFYNRECTSFVAWCLNSRNGIPFTNQYAGAARWGNAGDWGHVARSLGFAVDGSPAVGAVAWWSGGHVGWVSAVNGSSVTTEEYNWNGDGAYHVRTQQASDITGFIHVRDISPAAAGPVSFTFQDTGSYYFMSETTAQFGLILVYSSGNIRDVKTIGCELADSNGKLLADHQEDSYIRDDHLVHYFRINCDPGESDICYRLSPGTAYRFRCYVVYNGQKHYGDWRTFTTLGGMPVPAAAATPTPRPQVTFTARPAATSTPRPAAGQARLTATASGIGADGTFAVTIGIESNPGFGAMTISSDFAASGLSLVSAEAAGIASGASAAGGSRISLISADNITGDGTILKLTFRSPDRREATLSFSVDKAAKADQTQVSVAGASAAVRDARRTPGDANEDGSVDIVDAMMVLRYDCGWDVAISLANSDVNADGQADIVDAMMILRYDCGWDVTLK